MLELATVVWFSVAVFAAIGFGRGWSKAFIAMAGITLGLFALHQFDEVLREQLLTLFSAQNKFLLQTWILLIISFFALHTRAIVGMAAAAEPGEGRRDALQSKVLGGFVGAFNGYPASGSVRYLMHINNYPLAPYIEAPAEASLSLSTVNNLRPFVLAGRPGSAGDLLSLLVIVVFSSRPGLDLNTIGGLNR